MTLIAIVLALMLEQLHALPVLPVVQQPVAQLSGFLERSFNDGRYAHGVIAWVLGVATPSLVLLVLYVYLWAYQSVVALLLSIAVLYLTMGFRQFSHYFTEIQDALRAGDIDIARRTLATWRQHSGDRLSSSEVARLAIEEALLASHHQVFAPLFWFAILGPAGPVIYRLADLFKRHWGDRSDVEFGQFGTFSRHAFAVIDWLPVRLTAFAFAIVGDFEDAVYCWRTQASRWADGASGILLSSGAGALGVRLGLPFAAPAQLDDVDDIRPELGLGEEADPDLMQSTTGLVWRTLVLVLLLLALVWISGWMGG
jgi:adenosylcobinamide-phosphate synthase